MRVTLPKVKGPTIKGTVRMPIWFSPSPCLYTIPHCIPASCWCWYCCLVTKLCLTHLQTHGLYSLPGFSVHGIFQARILERVVISVSRGSSWSRDWTCISSNGRWILYHWATREALPDTELKVKSKLWYSKIKLLKTTWPYPKSTFRITWEWYITQNCYL